jgi:hypothetical protein
LKVPPSVIKNAALLPTPLLMCTPRESALVPKNSGLVILSGSLKTVGSDMSRSAPFGLPGAAGNCSPISQRSDAGSGPLTTLPRSTSSPITSDIDSLIAPDSAK